MAEVDDLVDRLLQDVNKKESELPQNKFSVESVFQDGLKGEIQDKIKGLLSQNPLVGNEQFKLLGKSIGLVIGFQILRAEQTGFPKIEMSFTDRGIYHYDGKFYPGGTNATFHGFLDGSYIFYGQGNGMSVAILDQASDSRTSSTWLVEGVAQLQPTLTGAGTYRGSMLYRWVDAPFSALNPMPAIFELTLVSIGYLPLTFTFGTIWTWAPPSS